MRLFLLAVACLFSLPSGSAAAGAGADPFASLALDAGARPAGMGGAYTALAGDAAGLAYNPAGLGAVDRSEALFMHNQHYQGVTQDSIGLALRQGFGARVDYLNYGSIPRTTISQPDKTLGTFGANELHAAAGFGTSLGGPVRAGVAGKLLQQTIDNVRASGYAVDCGLLIARRDGLGPRLGAAIQNLGPGVRFQSAREDLPLTLRAGAAYVLWVEPASIDIKPSQYTVSVDLSKERRDAAVFAFGLEGFFWKRAAVRFGYTSRDKAGFGFAFGLGWRSPRFSLDYALVPGDALGIAHRISASVRWGESNSEQPQGERPRGRREPLPEVLPWEGGALR